MDKFLNYMRLNGEEEEYYDDDYEDDDDIKEYTPGKKDFSEKKDSYEDVDFIDI